MPQRQGKKKHAVGAKAFPESRLLNLPAELRNQIYELVCRNDPEVEVSVRGKKVDVIPHPLARSCRQLRDEFLPMFEATALRHASTVTCYTTNLDIGGSALPVWLSQHPPKLSIGQRRYLLKSNLDSTFEQCLIPNCKQALQTFQITESESKPSKSCINRFELSINFNKRHIDIENLRRFVTANIPWRPDSILRKLEELLRDAFDRFWEGEADARCEKKIQQRRKRLRKQKGKKAKAKKRKGKKA